MSEAIYETRPITADSATNLGKPADRFFGAKTSVPDWYPETTKWSELGSPKALGNCMFVYPGVTSPGWNSCREGQTSNEAVYMSHGMAYVSSALKSRGHLVWLLDMRTCRHWREFEERVRQAEYDVAFVGFLSLDVFTATCVVRSLREIHPDRPVVVGGLHVSCCEMQEFPAKPGQPYYLPDLYLNRDSEMHPILRSYLDLKGETSYNPTKFVQANHVIWNEAEIAACKLVEERVAGNEVPPFINAHTIPDLNETPHADRDLFNLEFEANAPLLDYLPKPFFTVTFGRGCLSGGTKVDTVRGPVSIKELAETTEEIGVFTYDRKSKEMKVAKATHIDKIQENVRMVRVHFKNGKHVDCTPDHKFLVYRWGNQNVPNREWVVEAEKLKSGDRLRSMYEETLGPGHGYVHVCGPRRWKGDHNRCKKHLMIMEYSLGRKLKKGEECHHKDGDPFNNVEQNLELLASHKEHFKKHPEISERMKRNNPSSEDWTPERKNWTRPKNKGVGYIVERVECLPGLHDSYCLEVEGYGWFFCDNLLVKNCPFKCAFCNVGTQLSSAKVRLISPDYFMDELQTMHDRFGKIGSLMIHDDILLFPKWLEEWNLKLKARFGYTPYWCQMRADFICRYPDLIKTMAECGLCWISIGLESGSQRQLDMMGKQTTVEQNIQSCKICRDLGVNVFGNWMMGLPDETHEDRLATAAMMAEVAKGGIRHSASVYCNYPGTSLERYINLKGLLLPTWYTRSHFPWQRSISGINYQDVYDIQSEVTSKHPNRATKPKYWRDK